MSIFLLIVGIVLFIGLILVHEWGHFVAARRGGVGIEEYGIFFPPRLYKRTMKGGWLFSFNLIPLGGFVKLKGEHDTDTEPGSFGAASLWVKTKIMAAGIFMNLVVAYLLLVLLALVGMPQLLNNQFTIKSDTHVVAHADKFVQVSEVLSKSPAAHAGLKDNDTIKSVDGTSVHTAAELQAVTKKHAGQNVSVVYMRGGKTHTTYATLHAVETPTSGYLGVGIEDMQQGADMTRSTWSAPIVAGGLIGQYTGATFQGLGRAIAGLGGLIAGAATHNTVARQHGQTEASSQVSGPIGIAVILYDVSHLSYQFMLLIIALISLTLAIMNLLPIPALDGGRLWITLVARGFFKKPLTQRAEELVNLSGFAVLIVLSVVIAVVDVKRFF